MAKVIAIGQPVNDAERRAIAFLRDNLPDTYTVIHSFEIRRPREKQSYEIDIALIAPHSVFLIDVKGTLGHTDLYNHQWQPQGRRSYDDPLPKLRENAKVLKSLIQDDFPGDRNFAKLYTHAVVLLTAKNATIQDLSSKNTSDDITYLDQRCLTYFKGKTHIPQRFLNDIRPLHPQIISTIQGKTVPKSPFPSFGEWQTEEKLTTSETKDYIEYRAYNLYRGKRSKRSGMVRLRVYTPDPYQDEADHKAEVNRIGNAYDSLINLSPHTNILGIRNFFQTESGECILVLEDIPGNPLRQYLSHPQLSLTFDQKIAILQATLEGLNHAHKGEVIHRNLTPESIFLSPDGTTRLINFDYARAGKNRSQTIAADIKDKLDYSYQAPECDKDPSQASIASDLFSAGIVFYEMLTGERPFQTLTALLEADGIFPIPASQRKPDLPQGFDTWLQTLCAFDPEDRYSSAKIALHELNKLLLPTISPSNPAPIASPEKPLPNDLRHLPHGFKLNNRFVIQKPLGSGGFAATYQVLDAYNDQLLVIKLIDRDRSSTFQRFLQEYKKLSNLPEHPHVIKLQWGDRFPDETPYIVFPYIDGSTVEDQIGNAALTREDAVHTVALQTAQGLEHLHANGVYHQDIKPDNLYWTAEGIRILDFNVSVSDQDTQFKAGGTRRYMPPDFDIQTQPTPEEMVDRDLYALGITLYECITGKHPFDGKNPPLNHPAPDPRQFDQCDDLSADLVALIQQAIAPHRSQRFRTAKAFQEAIANLKHLHLAIPPIEPPCESTLSTLTELTPTQPNFNPFVSYLLTLYSQSQQTNAGTRGLDQNSKRTYIPTLLDDALSPAILNGEFRLVLISGNAGDGKTAFIQKLEEQVAASLHRSLNGSTFTHNGRAFLTNYDGSQDEAEKENTDVLLEFLAPFTGSDPTTWQTTDTRIIAINEGRLVDFLSEHPTQFVHLTQLVRQGLRGSDAVNGMLAVEGVLVINLNLRSVVADAHGENSSIFDRLIRRFTTPKFWQACQSCDLKDRCYVHHNARTFIDTKSGAKVIHRLKTLYTLTHLRGRLHITLRDLRSALAFTLAGTRDCNEIHALYQSNALEARQEILSSFYFNAWMGGESGSRDRLLSLLREIDMGETSDPQRDRTFAFLEPDRRDKERLTFGDRAHQDTALLSKIFADLPRDYSSKMSRDTVQQYSTYVAMLRRRHYFEQRDFEQRDDQWQTMLPYRSAPQFLKLVQETPDLDQEVRSLIMAINRGEGLRNPDQLGGDLALQVRQVDRGTIRSYRLFDEAMFLLAIPTAGIISQFLEYLPQAVLLRYTSSSHPAELLINLDVYEMLVRLKQGYRPSVEEQQGIYRNLMVFKNILASAPYQEVLLSETGREFFSIRRDEQGNLSLAKRGDT